MSNSLLRLPVVLKQTGLSRSSLYALARKGEFPQPVKISARASAWPAQQVESWIEARIAASRGEAS